MRIAIDMDNVSMDAAPYILAAINRKYNTNLTIEDIKEWYSKWPHNGSFIDYTKELFEQFDQPGFLERMPLMPGAKEGINELLERGHKVFMLTGRHPRYNEPSLHSARQIHPNLKVVHAPEGKHHHMDKFDLLLDDAPKEVRNVGLRGGNAIIYDRPWNRDVSPLYGNRVKDWGEFLNSIKRL